MPRTGLIHFAPIYKSKVWGGTALAELFHRHLPANDIGESWELSDRGPDTNIADLPPALKSRSLRDIIAADPDYILGRRAHARWGHDKFPLLCKFIHAREDLSVQVHPPDPYAQKHEQEYGKAECWVILAVEPGARIQRGLKPGVTRETFAAALKAGTVEDCLHYFTPKVGDVLALPTGCVHAIGAGIVLAEIQQNSDVTYRVFDYNRPGLDGKPRALHIEKALDVTGFDRFGDEFGDPAKLLADTVTPQMVRDQDNHGMIEELLADGGRFTLSRVTVQLGRHRLIRPPPKRPLGANPVTDACEVWMILHGAGSVGVNEMPPLPATAGDTFLVPGAEPAAWLMPTAPTTLLRAIPAG